jgi:hypothetical protein
VFTTELIPTFVSDVIDFVSKILSEQPKAKRISTCAASGGENKRGFCEI